MSRLTSTVPRRRTPPGWITDCTQEQVAGFTRRHRRKSLLTQGVLFLLVAAVWGLPIVNPVKLLVVLIHELSHGLMAYASGGLVFGIAIEPGGAGVTLGIGGHPGLILVAGYGGSLLVGAKLFCLLNWWDTSEVWWFVMLFSILSMGLGWLNDFTAIFGIGSMVLLLLGAMSGEREWKLIALRVLATTSCLYPALDIGMEVAAGPGEAIRVNDAAVGSDLSRFSALTDWSMGAIAAIWIVLSLALVYGMIRWSAECDARRETKATLFRRAPKDYAEALYYGDPTNPPRYRIG